MDALPPVSIRPLAAPAAKGEGKGVFLIAEPIAVDAVEAARLFGVSPSFWRKLDRAGAIPLPVKLGARVLWTVRELRAWADAGCPPRGKWLLLSGSRHDSLMGKKGAA